MIADRGYSRRSRRRSRRRATLASGAGRSTPCTACGSRLGSRGRSRSPTESTHAASAASRATTGAREPAPRSSTTTSASASGTRASSSARRAWSFPSRSRSFARRASRRTALNEASKPETGIGIVPSEWDDWAVPHRDDLQGLRAVAVLVVVLNHAGVPFLGGGYIGVDVFFVLSGFLITGLLLSQAERDGRVRLADFYVRRARRILPAAVLTLVVTIVAAHQLLNFVRAREAVNDSLWAAFFAANVHFARVGSDYFAQGEPPSPVQHFWTLAVEEQFYLVWPVALSLLLFVGFLRRRALLVVALAGLASLAWSIHATAAEQAGAYFSTAARAWELALGAGLAMAAPRLRHVPPALGWVGLACILASAVAYSSATAFPGYAALLPTVGAALVIAAGIGRTGAAGRLLSLSPFRYVGDRSYALYLWHWPVLVLGAGYAGHDLSTATRLALLAGAFLLSILSYALVENPIRHMRWRPQTGALLWPASAAVIVAVAMPILGSLNTTATRISNASAAVRPDALVKPATVARSSWKPLPAVAAAVAAARRGADLPWPLTPSVSQLRQDFYSFPRGCVARRDETSSRVCRLGGDEAAKTIVVIGDSHAQMWMPTIL